MEVLTDDEELIIKLNSDQDVYFPGQIINGTVEFETSRNYKARGATIKFEGKAHVKWTESADYIEQDPNRSRHQVTLSSTEEYVNSQLLLWSSESEENILPPGHYCWPFTFQIPAMVPASVEGEFGYIRYNLKAEIDRPYRFDDTKKTCLTISSWIDLNQIPEAIQQSNQIDHENIGSCCHKRGFLKIHTCIPKTGYVSGEIIPINVNVKNTSSVKVEELIARIVQKMDFIATDRYNPFPARFNSSNTVVNEVRTTKKTIEKSRQAIEILPKSEITTAITIRVPSIPASISENSRFIHVSYEVVVEAETTAFLNSNASTVSPIIIGTVPINFNQDGDKSAQFPYTYEDSMFGADGTHLDAQSNSKPFAPKYPVYNNLPIYNPTAPPVEQ